MAEHLEELPYRELLDEFAAGKAAPGGGAGGAVVGALGAALVSMVCNLTIGKRKYREVQPRLADILELAQDLREQFLQLATQDTEAFSRVMNAYRLPKTTDEERAVRTREIQEGLRGATEIPLSMMRTALKLMKLASEVLLKGNRNAASDAAAAVRLGFAAVGIGRYNVMINLAGIKDSSYLEKCRSEAEEIACESENILEEAERLFEQQVLP